MDGTVLVCGPWTVQHGSRWDASAGFEFATLQKVTLDKVWAVNGGWANASPGHPMRIVPGTLNGTPKGRVQTPARPPPHAARHVHAYNRRAHGEQACQTGVQILHACLEGVQSLHALWTGVQALHACGLTTLIRVPKYPYKGTSRTLIRVPVPL
ncbi:hypothetical protein PCANC_14559 [Puccinia coronata f. sp. avenae]|uniref:Uncharacterized protein n=1 Tax=Puccinia coronata f. sp. avenae TaxID=200324 RepID=A0A2N5UK03_9BASI|nr:hypothetical protein PCANC_14559 [Puccinia coronata f. sp. avenae]